MNNAYSNRYSQMSFATMPSVNRPRSTFDRSHTFKDTYYFDQLVPFQCTPILPGDSIVEKLNCFARLTTQVFPLMDNAYIDFFWFFVPNRLLWTNWERFCGAQDDPGDSISFSIPQIVAPAVTGWGNNSTADHFGLPTEMPSVSVSCLPFRALCKISNDWFRDQNQNDSIPFPTDDGPDVAADYVAADGWSYYMRNKKPDYFTTCTPLPQRGTAIDIPFATGATTVPVTRVSNAAKWISFQAGANTHPAAGTLKVEADGDLWSDNGAGGPLMSFDPNGGLVVDVDSYAGTINALLQNWAINDLLINDNRYGTRYVELLYSHWGVISPDFRLQRSEYLAGGSITINSHPVPQTSATSGTNYQGKLTSFATASSQGANLGFSKAFTEHGYVIGLLCPRGEVTYQQGVNRHWKDLTRYDFFWPELQDTVDQAVLKQELGAVGTSQDTEVFGYQERYAHLKFHPSEIRGEFRSNYATSLDFAHLAQDLTGFALNDEFLVQNTDIDRNLASTTNAPVWMDGFIQMKHTRVMKVRSTPASLTRL